MITNSINVEFITISNLSDFQEEYRNLILECEKILQKAYSPYSHFQVGAALLLENGQIITGNNQENAAYPSGLCAERTALFYAKAQFPNLAIKAMAIAGGHQGILTKSPISPCGACRQVIAEYNALQKQPVTLILRGNDFSYLINNSNDLLPLSFTL